MPEVWTLHKIALTVCVIAKHGSLEGYLFDCRNSSSTSSATAVLQSCICTPGARANLETFSRCFTWPTIRIVRCRLEPRSVGYL